MNSSAVAVKTSVSFRLRDADVAKILVIIAGLIQLLMMLMK